MLSHSGSESRDRHMMRMAGEPGGKEQAGVRRHEVSSCYSEKHVIKA